MEIIPLNPDTVDVLAERTGLNREVLLSSYFEAKLNGKDASYVFYNKQSPQDLQGS